MKGLLAAAGLAMILHALLFTVEGDWLTKRVVHSAARHAVTLSMVYTRPQPRMPSPEAPPAQPEKKPETAPPKPLVQTPEPPPIKKGSRAQKAKPKHL